MLPSLTSFETPTVGVNGGFGSIEDSFNLTKSGWSPQTLSVDSLKCYEQNSNKWTILKPQL